MKLELFSSTSQFSTLLSKTLSGIKRSNVESPKVKAETEQI